MDRMEYIWRFPDNASTHIVDGKPTIFFKSGRAYTEHGQRMAAQLLDCGSIIFVDKDRMIYGRFPAAVVTEHKLTLRPALVMMGYDHHEVTQYWINAHGFDEQIGALRKAADEHWSKHARGVTGTHNDQPEQPK